jgi:hypothetical protein
MAVIRNMKKVMQQQQLGLIAAAIRPLAGMVVLVGVVVRLGVATAAAGVGVSGSVQILWRCCDS